MGENVVVGSYWHYAWLFLTFAQRISLTPRSRFISFTTNNNAHNWMRNIQWIRCRANFKNLLYPDKILTIKNEIDSNIFAEHSVHTYVLPIDDKRINLSTLSFFFICNLYHVINKIYSFPKMFRVLLNQKPNGEMKVFLEVCSINNMPCVCMFECSWARYRYRKKEREKRNTMEMEKLFVCSEIQFSILVVCSFVRSFCMVRAFYSLYECLCVIWLFLIRCVFVGILFITSSFVFIFGARFRFVKVARRAKF